eukprot:12610572-Alexandrium_andersonii.AAC.1
MPPAQMRRRRCPHPGHCSASGPAGPPCPLCIRRACGGRPLVPRHGSLQPHTPGRSMGSLQRVRGGPCACVSRCHGSGARA